MSARLLWTICGCVGCWTWLAYVGAMIFAGLPPNGFVDLMLMGGIAAFARAQELRP